MEDMNIEGLAAIVTGGASIDWCADILDGGSLGVTESSITRRSSVIGG
jgi:hypothetical protein